MPESAPRAFGVVVKVLIVGQLSNEVRVSERVAVETVTVGRGGGRDLCADLYRPPAPNGAGVLLIHGGSFVRGNRGQLHGYGIALGRVGYTCLYFCITARSPRRY